MTAWTTAVTNPSRVRVHLQFAVPTDADSIEVDTSRSPSTTSWATPSAGQFRGPWEAEWAQWDPPREGCVVMARAWAGTVTSNDVQIDWCLLEAGGG